ncbi:MAG: biotin transporter BioY [Lacticaseibacillus songhuajiangensis]|jgi:biotin transport system substrate-specific component|nr:biotin transporter BioY [Lacticaseibacillus songhuajiangensis]
MTRIPLRRLTLTAMMTAVICAVAPLAIPLGAVPFSLQTFIIPLVATVCAPSVALTATALYLLIGGLGLPVFVGYTAGFGHFFTPTGGYLLAMLLFPLIISVALKWHRSLVVVVGSNLLAGMLQLVAGSLWLAVATGMALPAALVTGTLAFVPAMLVKVALILICERAAERSGALSLTKMM